MIYCFIKTFVRNEIKLLPLYIFVFAVLVEIGQYFNLAELLGLSDYTIARVIINAKMRKAIIKGCATHGQLLYQGQTQRIQLLYRPNGAVF